MNDQKKKAHKNARASHFSLARALSVLSYQCSNTLACFYRYGLEDTHACQHLIETQKTIDEALKDTLILAPIKPYETALIGAAHHVAFSTAADFSNFSLASFDADAERHDCQKKREEVAK
ncbi:hypothetical protein [Marinomonas posidonica]|uniref:hypothetical protein n=1 Tax=Marinomonas posidonica TaxID=936476 RepID=UPI0037365385